MKVALPGFPEGDRLATWKPGGVVRFLIKGAISTLLLGWLASRGSLERVGDCLARVSLPWFLLALATYLVGQTVCAWKWSVLGRLLGFRQPFRFYWLNYLAGMFVSLFLPTTVGGDAYRTLKLSRENGEPTSAAISVLADRGTGVLAMAWIATLAAAGTSLPLPPGLRPAVIITCAVLTLGFLTPFLARPAGEGSGLPARVLECWKRPGGLFLSLGLALVFQTLAVAVYVLLGRALGLPPAPLFYAVLCPLVSLASMAPLTVNGLGVREWALAALFPLVGVGPEAAIAFGLAWAAMAILASLAGGAALLLAGESMVAERAGLPDVAGKSHRRGATHDGY